MCAHTHTHPLPQTAKQWRSKCASGLDVYCRYKIFHSMMTAEESCQDCFPTLSSPQFVHSIEVTVKATCYFLCGITDTQICINSTYSSLSTWNKWKIMFSFCFWRGRGGRKRFMNTPLKNKQAKKKQLEVKYTSEYIYIYVWNCIYFI